MPWKSRLFSYSITSWSVFFLLCHTNISIIYVYFLKTTLFIRLYLHLMWNKLVSCSHSRYSSCKSVRTGSRRGFFFLRDCCGTKRLILPQQNYSNRRIATARNCFACSFAVMFVEAFWLDSCSTHVYGRGRRCVDVMRHVSVQICGKFEKVRAPPNIAAFPWFSRSFSVIAKNSLEVNAAHHVTPRSTITRYTSPCEWDLRLRYCQCYSHRKRIIFRPIRIQNWTALWFKRDGKKTHSSDSTRCLASGPLTSPVVLLWWSMLYYISRDALRWTLNLRITSSCELDFIPSSH